MEEPDEHTSLVKRVKQVQRESEESKQQWWAFCELEGKNRRDPQRHTLHSLRRFFQLREQGGLPKTRLEPGTHQSLVQKVKDAVRMSPELKQKWADYCDKQSGGYRDPQRHSTKSIETFFEFYAAEPPPVASGSLENAKDAAALAALSPEVTCVTIKGQKAFVVELSEPVYKAMPQVLLHPLAAHVTSAPSLVESSLALEAGQAGQAGQACAQRLAMPQGLPAISQSDPALGHGNTPTAEKSKVMELESRSNAPPTQGSTLLDRFDASRERSRTPEKVKFAVVLLKTFHY